MVRFRRSMSSQRRSQAFEPGHRAGVAVRTRRTHPIVALREADFDHNTNRPVAMRCNPRDDLTGVGAGLRGAAGGSRSEIPTCTISRFSAHLRHGRMPALAVRSAGREVLLNAFGGCRGRRAQEPRPELLTVWQSGGWATRQR